jgi:hypothetical protein
MAAAHSLHRNVGRQTVAPFPSILEVIRDYARPNTTKLLSETYSSPLCLSRGFLGSPGLCLQFFVPPFFVVAITIFAATQQVRQTFASQRVCGLA